MSVFCVLQVNKLLMASKVSEIFFLFELHIFERKTLNTDNTTGILTIVVRLVKIIVDAIVNQETTQSVLLDLSKNFDSFNQATYIHKLEYFGIVAEPLKWMKSYLGNSTIR